MDATSDDQNKKGKKGLPKGRQITPDASACVQRILGDQPRDGSLLLEFLHSIQDDQGHLSSANLAALAHELKLSQAEVY